MAGVLVGLFVGRRFREMPRVKCVASDWDVAVYEGAGPLGRAVCSFEVDLFNEGALATGLRGPSVAFDGADGDRVAVARLKDAVSKQDLWALDLPSRSWTHASVYALLEEEVQDALSFRRVHLVGEFPDGNNFETKMVERRTTSPPARGPPTPQDYVASRNLRARFLERKRATGLGR